MLSNSGFANRSLGKPIYVHLILEMSFHCFVLGNLVKQQSHTEEKERTCVQINSVLMKNYF